MAVLSPAVWAYRRTSTPVTATRWSLRLIRVVACRPHPSSLSTRSYLPMLAPVPSYPRSVWSYAVDRARFLYREIVGNINVSYPPTLCAYACSTKTAVLTWVFGGCSDSFLDALCVVVSEVSPTLSSYAPPTPCPVLRAVHFNPEEPLFETRYAPTRSTLPSQYYRAVCSYAVLLCSYAVVRR
eukprot:2676226-Rhodomonas_salina.4